MTKKTKILIVEGPDGAGKSSLIKWLCSVQPFCDVNHTYFQELKFPKELPSGQLLRLNDEKSFAIIETLFEFLDPSYVYVLDRFIPSNIVYDSVFRNEDVSKSLEFLEDLQKLFDVEIIYLTRDYINEDFVDDKISMSKDQFNQCIKEYRELGINYQILIRGQAGHVLALDEDIHDQVAKRIWNFVLR